MRIFRACAAAVCLTAFGAGAALALDPNLSAGEAFSSGYQAYKAGDAETAIEALNFAADHGHAAALWKLGRMYQNGDLVSEDAHKAIELYARVARDYGDGNPRGPHAPFVADALVTLGSYYLNGVPDAVDPNPEYALRLFRHAASIFGNAEAQYLMARMLHEGVGSRQDTSTAAAWYRLAANKGHVGAQSELGHMLFEGIGVGRRPAEGLKWLSIARLASPGDPVIQARHEQAFSTANEELRRAAMTAAETWMTNRTGGAQAQAPQAEAAAQAQ